MSRPGRAPYTAEPNVAEIAALLAEPTRAAILFALLDGRERPASELASRAGASPQAARAHLSKLVGGGLLAVTAAGRQRLFRLASPDVAHAIEALATIAKPPQVVALSQTTTIQRLRDARSCYDHLAGRLGIAVTDHFVERRALRLVGDAFELTRHGATLFRELGIDVERAPTVRRPFARACTDWTERRPHLAGLLGERVLNRYVAAGWLKRNASDRALRITPEGQRELERRLHIHC